MLSVDEFYCLWQFARYAFDQFAVLAVSCPDPNWGWSCPVRLHELLEIFLLAENHVFVGLGEIPDLVVFTSVGASDLMLQNWN